MKAFILLFILPVFCCSAWSIEMSADLFIESEESSMEEEQILEMNEDSLIQPLEKTHKQVQSPLKRKVAGLEQVVKKLDSKEKALYEDDTSEESQRKPTSSEDLPPVYSIRYDDFDIRRSEKQ